MGLFGHSINRERKSIKFCTLEKETFVGVTFAKWKFCEIFILNEKSLSCVVSLILHGSIIIIIRFKANKLFQVNLVIE